MAKAAKRKAAAKAKPKGKAKTAVKPKAKAGMLVTEAELIERLNKIEHAGIAELYKSAGKKAPKRTDRIKPDGDGDYNYVSPPYDPEELDEEDDELADLDEDGDMIEQYGVSIETIEKKARKSGVLKPNEKLVKAK